MNAESARFNIGRVERNFNVPTTVLFYFTRDHQERFKFTAKGVQADGSWEIAYRETQHPTLIRTPEGKSVPSDGSIWVKPADGTIVRTLLKVGGDGIGAPKGTRGDGTIDVTYSRVAALDMWLPESMLEQFETKDRDTWETVTGRATLHELPAVPDDDQDQISSRGASGAKRAKGAKGAGAKGAKGAGGAQCCLVRLSVRRRHSRRRARV